MKKKCKALLAGALSLMMLTACGASSSSTAAPASSSGSAGSSTAAASDTAWPEDVQEIVDRGVLRVGVKNAVPGFGYQDPLTGEYSGMEIDLANLVADYLGVETEFTTVTAATRGELLDSGDIDCVLVEDSSGITSLADLVGKTVGVSSGSTSARELVRAMVEKGLVSGDNFDPDTFDPTTWTEGVSFHQYEDYPTISTALSAGEVDAFCVDRSILAIYKTEGRSYIQDEFAPQEYGIATTKGSGLSEVCEDLVTTWLSDGTIDGLISEYGL